MALVFDLDIVHNDFQVTSRAINVVQHRETLNKELNVREEPM